MTTKTRAPAPAAEPALDAARPRRTLGTGAALLLLGLAMVGVGQASAGSVVTLAGLALVLYGIHTFGRLGPEE